MKTIEFVSYDGEYPLLCHGNLVLKIDSENYNFQYGMKSGGCCGYDEETGRDYIYEADWEFHPDSSITKFKGEFTKEEIEYIEKLVNENVQHPCCGGCL